MEELTVSLATSFEVSHEPLSTSRPHPRFVQYKEKRTVDQNTRRKRLLHMQKQNRYDYTNHLRRLAEDDWKDFSDDDDSDEIIEYKVEGFQQELHVGASGEAEGCKDLDEESMECEAYIRPERSYKNQLMHSEWLVDVPTNLAEEWIMVICPVGKRSLVVASKSITTVYTKSGIIVNQFNSHLPGGHKDYTILDCIYSETDRTYYVLDIMCWASYPIVDSEAEFRFYWMINKILDCPLVTQTSELNPYKFIPLMQYDCKSDTISSAMTHKQQFEVDGILFYDRRTHYTFGSTPLVVWLKPFMIPEILNIAVLDEYMEKMPKNYTSYVDHLVLVKKNQDLYKRSKHDSPEAPKPVNAHGGSGNTAVVRNVGEHCAEDLSQRLGSATLNEVNLEGTEIVGSHAMGELECVQCDEAGDAEEIKVENDPKRKPGNKNQNRRARGKKLRNKWDKKNVVTDKDFWRNMHSGPPKRAANRCWQKNDDFDIERSTRDIRLKGSHSENLNEPSAGNYFSNRTGFTVMKGTGGGDVVEVTDNHDNSNTTGAASSGSKDQVEIVVSTGEGNAGDSNETRVKYQEMVPTEITQIDRGDRTSSFNISDQHDKLSPQIPLGGVSSV